MDVNKMKYTDVGTLSLDEFCGTLYGQGGHLQVVGRSNISTSKKKLVRLYALVCDVCRTDPELYGDGVFLSLKGSLVSGQIPCGCSPSARKTPEQYSLICYRKADEMGYKFLGFAEEFRGRSTKIKLSCPKHGTWSSGIINNFTRRGVGCPDCKKEGVSARKRKEDSLLIEKYLSSSLYSEGTTIKRSTRQTSKGHFDFWEFSCPVCTTTATVRSDSLRKGCLPCDCSKQNQKSAYINILYDGEIPSFVKFGISNKPESRLRDQERLSLYKVINHSVYNFPSVENCKKAEQECIKYLETRVVPENYFSDGYTETTFLYNLDRVIELYESNGGINRGSLDELSFTMGE